MAGPWEPPWGSRQRQHAPHSGASAGGALAHPTDHRVVCAGAAAVRSSPTTAARCDATHTHADPPVPHPPPSSCSQCTGEWLRKYREKLVLAKLSTQDVSHIIRLLNQAGVGRYEAGGFFVERLPNADGPPRRGRHRAAPRRRRADLEAQGQGDAGRLRPEAHALARGGCRTTAAWLQRRASGVMISISRCVWASITISLQSDTDRVLCVRHAPQLPFWASFRVGANWRTGLARSERHCGGAGPLCLRWLAPVTYQVRAARLEPARRRPSVNLLVLD